uniref:Adenylate kinase n=1 Tax=Macrostomum lignano TaxID=282301 RepID=A0A1I8GZR5_9PLAT
ISSSINEWRIAFVLGKPGSGKGTQGQLLASRLGLHHLSAGELLRSELKRLSDTPTGQDIANRMLTGKIVPSEITCRLLLDNMAASAVSSADLRANLSVAGVLLFDVSDETCLSRCLERSGSVGVGCRADDNATTLAKRLQSYSADTEPVVEEFQRLGLLHRIDAS